MEKLKQQYSTTPLNNSVKFEEIYEFVTCHVDGLIENYGEDNVKRAIKDDQNSDIIQAISHIVEIGTVLYLQKSRIYDGESGIPDSEKCYFICVVISLILGDYLRVKRLLQPSYSGYYQERALHQIKDRVLLNFIYLDMNERVFGLYLKCLLYLTSMNKLTYINSQVNTSGTNTFYSDILLNPGSIDFLSSRIEIWENGNLILNKRYKANFKTKVLIIDSVNTKHLLCNFNCQDLGDFLVNDFKFYLSITSEDRFIMLNIPEDPKFDGPQLKFIRSAVSRTLLSDPSLGNNEIQLIRNQPHYCSLHYFKNEIVKITFITNSPTRLIELHV